MRRTSVIAVIALLAGLWFWLQPAPIQPPFEQVPAVVTHAETSTPAMRTAQLPAWLPAEAGPVLAAIQRGGPYAYPQDGGTFQNRERLLPPQPRGYYREFTVDTPGSLDRGARRIVTGGDPPSGYWYTADHYRSFRAFDPGTVDREPAQ